MPRSSKVVKVLPSSRKMRSWQQIAKVKKMSYLQHWKLSRSPFSLGPNGRGVFTGGTIEEAFARSDFLVSQEKRLGLVIGPSGVGKSTFLNHFRKVRNSKNPREKLALIDLRCADGDTVPIRILNGFSLESDAQASAQHCWLRINDHLFAESAIGHRTILLLDNGHDVNDDVYQGISQLWSSPIRWSMLMSVDDESIVNLPRWILDQCELKIDLPSWDLGQTADYFDFALHQVGGDVDIFNGQAITRIQELSDGIPRKIAQISELALVAGAVRRSERVTSELVDQVCDEFTVSVGGKFLTNFEGQRLNAG